jgi:transcriptional regulator with XRE-family HTH domain
LTKRPAERSTFGANGPEQVTALRDANTPLRRARLARGWSQETTARKLRQLAAEWGCPIAEAEALKGQVAGWEKGRRLPREKYRKLLCAVFETTPEGLGFPAFTETVPDVDAPPAATEQAADTPLGRARLARGWSQEKAARAMVLLADSWGWPLPSESSLRSQLSRWENGHGKPGRKFEVLLCALYRATPEDLGFPETRPEVEALGARIASLESLVARLADALTTGQGATA